MPGDMSRSALALLLAATEHLDKPEAAGCGPQPQPAGINSHSSVAVHRSCLGFIDLAPIATSSGDALSLASAAATRSTFET